MTKPIVLSSFHRIIDPSNRRKLSRTQGPRFVQRPAFANALWLSTALTGLATTRYTMWSTDIWKRFSLDSANVTGTSQEFGKRVYGHADLVPFLLAGRCSSGARLVRIVTGCAGIGRTHSGPPDL